MSHSISTLLTRNLHEVFGEGDPARRRATIDEIFTEDCVFYQPQGVHRGRDEVDQIAGAIRATIRTSNTRPRPNRRSCIMPVASDGYRAALARHRPMPEPTSSSLAMAGLPPFTSSSTPSSAADEVQRFQPKRRARVLVSNKDLSRKTPIFETSLYVTAGCKYRYRNQLC